MPEPTIQENREIDGKARTVRELLSKRKYVIDYYQRGYKWAQKQIQELVDDLTGRFLEDYEEGHERAEVAGYGHYFLGSVIISHKDKQYFIIDGQQRMTSLTLLLIYLNNLQKDNPKKVVIDDLIASERYDRRSFNIDVEERNVCMEALLTGDETFDPTQHNEAVQTMHGRYADISDYFPEELHGTALPYFIDWLLENVHVVEITAYSDADAYTIFETMNDRGLSLTPTEMLKGYLLANITDEKKRLTAAETWKSRGAELSALWKEADADAIKTWLRAHWARDIRPRKKGAKAQDWDQIGTQFHRWVRDEAETLKLKHSHDFHQFITGDFDFYARQFARVVGYARTRTPGFETIFYNSQNQFTLQYQLLLAPLLPTDSDAILQRKVRVVARFLDVLLFRRIWNFRAIDYSTLQYAMFVITKEIRGQSVDALVAKLTTELENEKQRFSSSGFALNQGNRKQIVRLLARFTDYIETASGQPSHYLDYTAATGSNRFEVEHICANKPERHTVEFPEKGEFHAWRNRIAGLVLVPKKFNTSYGALAYDEKRPHYLTQNWLAASLDPAHYERNPGFKQFITKMGLPFKPHPEFKKQDQLDRLELYRQLCELIWNPDFVAKEAQS